MQARRIVRTDALLKRQLNADFKQVSGNLLQRKYLIRVFGSLFLALCILPLGLCMFIYSSSTGQIRTQMTQVSEQRYAMVLGAQVNDIEPTFALQQRLDKTIELYETGKIKKILVSGDSTTDTGDEISVMQTYLLEHEINEADIILDNEGVRTFDSCLRAKEVHGLSELIVVSQTEHLYRAIYLCSAFGISTVGVSANPNEATDWGFALREFWAMMKAVIDVSTHISAG